MGSDIRDRLGAGEVLLLDGGLGALFIVQGLETGRAPEWWVLEHPDRVTAAHRAYVEAGSDIIHTCTFGASPPKLLDAGLGERCADINRRAVELAREACAGSRTVVAGDLGPTGCLFPPMGKAQEDELEQAFSEQVSVLADAGADLISIETMYDLREALAAVRAAAATGLPVLASMTFDLKKRGFFSMVGDQVETSLSAMLEAGATAVGFNCSLEAAEMVALVQEAKAALAGYEGAAYIMAQPNAGQPRATAGGVVYDADPDEFVACLEQMVGAGANILGGCCGTDPGFIRKARAALDALHSPPSQPRHRGAEREAG